MTVGPSEKSRRVQAMRHSRNAAGASEMATIAGDLRGEKKRVHD
jgi:hypothetical protein